MTITFEPTRTVESAAEAYVVSRGKAQFVSINHAIRAIRTLMPDCDATDRDLADILAAASIRHGMSVSFDVVTSRPIQIGAASPPLS